MQFSFTSAQSLSSLLLQGLLTGANCDPVELVRLQNGIPVVLHSGHERSQCCFTQKAVTRSGLLYPTSVALTPAWSPSDRKKNELLKVVVTFKSQSLIFCPVRFSAFLKEQPREQHEGASNVQKEAVAEELFESRAASKKSSKTVA